MKQLLERLITLQEAQPERLAAALADALKDFRQPVSSSPVVSLVSDLPGEDLPKQVEVVALPAKAELARQWLNEHPEDMQLTGRELESQRRPQGVKISYVTWNAAKKSRTK